MLSEDIIYEDFLKLKQEFEEKERQFERKSWIDTQVNELDELMRLNYNRQNDEFASIVLNFLADLTNAYSGVMYIINPDTEMIEAICGYSCLLSNLPKTSYQLGEDIIGQVVKTKKLLIYDNILIENKEIPIQQSEKQASTLIFLPLVFNEVAYGLIELAYITVLDTSHKEVLQKVSRNIAIMLESITASTLTQNLLQSAQEQASRLQAQEEELRQNLEELQATQEKMVQKQLEAEHLTKKLSANESILKKSLDNAKENQKKIFAILENCPMGIIQISKNGLFLMTNSTGNILLGIEDNASLPTYEEVFKVLKIEKLRVGDKKRTKIFKMDGSSFMAEVFITELNKDWLLFFKDVSEDIRKEQELILSLERSEQLKSEFLAREQVYKQQLGL